MHVLLWQNRHFTVHQCFSNIFSSPPLGRSKYFMMFSEVDVHIRYFVTIGCVFLVSSGIFKHVRPCGVSCVLSFHYWQIPTYFVFYRHAIPHSTMPHKELAASLLKYLSHISTECYFHKGCDGMLPSLKSNHIIISLSLYCLSDKQFNIVSQHKNSYY